MNPEIPTRPEEPESFDDPALLADDEETDDE